MALVKIIEEQSVFGFTGRINILLRPNGQFVGAIFIREGDIVDCRFGKVQGERALYQAIFEDLDDGVAYTYIVEPEVIDLMNIKFHLSIENLKVNAQKLYSKYLESKKFKPPGHLRLVLNGAIVSGGPKITSDEFKIMNIMTEYSKVTDIYCHAGLYDFEVTQALVSLRKKKAIVVYENK